MTVRAVRGADHVAAVERAADTNRNRLLADAGVQEAGQVAGAEALLDLLFEAPDQQHLAEERDELLVRETSAWALIVPVPSRSTRSTRRQL